jgi:nicotinamide mononucleotide transporter
MEFLIGMLGARPIEWLAVALGLANITLLIRRSIWNYPFGMVMVTIYAWIFFDAKLYGQTLLQPIYFVIQAYGWANWLGRRDASGLVIVRRVSAFDAAILIAGVIFGAVVFGTLMDRFTDATAPYADGLIAALFICAQILLANRYLENWLLWIAGDVLAIALYWSQGLQPTAVLYVAFLALSVFGLLEWRKAVRNDSAENA